ncbi:iojap family protein [gamma proteobacterium HTCC5015]|nr:iojap family protein [gamma proteobacterium HTCC5015]
MQFEALKELVLEALDDVKAKEITQLDVKGKTSVTDLIIVAIGTSNRHVKSLANSVSTACKKADVPPLGVEGERDGDWVLVDLGDIVVHVMQPEVRDYYNLEKLWEVDATAVEQMRGE